MIENIGNEIYESIEEFVEDLGLMNDYKYYLVSLGEDKDVYNKDDLTQEFLNTLAIPVAFVPHSKGEGLIIIL